MEKGFKNCIYIMHWYRIHIYGINQLLTSTTSFTIAVINSLHWSTFWTFPISLIFLWRYWRKDETQMQRKTLKGFEKGPLQKPNKTQHKMIQAKKFTIQKYNIYWTKSNSKQLNTTWNQTIFQQQLQWIIWRSKCPPFQKSLSILRQVWVKIRTKKIDVLKLLILKNKTKPNLKGQ